MAPQWGLYLNAQPAIVAESCVAVQFRHDYRVPDYPLESGAFQSYDKVWQPFLIHMKLSQGKNAEARQTFLNALEALAANTLVYDAVTPEKTYASVNVVHYDYDRKADAGVSLINAELWLQQILANVTPQFGSVKSPNSANPISGGTAQTQSVSPQQRAVIQSSLDLKNAAMQSAQSLISQATM